MGIKRNMYQLILSKFIVGVSLSITLTSCYANTQKIQVTTPMSSKIRTIANVQLSPKTVDLVEEIEKLCGKPLEVVYKDFDNKTQLADSRITEDNVPLIAINKSKQPTEEIIVHELFHLEFRSKGFKLIRFLLPLEQSTKQNIDFLNLLELFLRDSIEHTMFYPKMRTMGIDPTKKLNQLWVQKLHEESNLNNGPDTRGHTLDYVKVLLELDNEQLSSQIEQFYKNNNWNNSLNIANNIKQILLTKAPKNADEEVATVLECAKAFYPGTANYNLIEYKDLPQTLREHFANQKIANIAFIMVSPPK